MYDVLDRFDVQVLQELRYIDEDQSIKLKGKVAREMHNQEVLVTELLFNNKLTQLEPAEIVALLSCIVFQQVSCCISDWSFLNICRLPSLPFLYFHFPSTSCQLFGISATQLMTSLLGIQVIAIFRQGSQLGYNFHGYYCAMVCSNTHVYQYSGPLHVLY